MFCDERKTMFMAVITTIKIENIKSVMVAFLYKGAGDKDPSSHVTRIPPELVMMKPIAMAVARRACGAALLALHVDKEGAAQYAPGIDRNKEPYFACTV